MTRTTARRRSAQRGMTILESMIAMAILTVGVIGAATGILTASRQNSMAGRIGKAAAIASAVRAGFSVHGAARLLSTTDGLLMAGNCSSDAAVKARAGGLDAVTKYKYTDKAGMTQERTVTPCVIDLDAWESSKTDDAKIVPGYQDPDEIFRRVVVYFPDGNTPPQQLMMTVVVSWRELGRLQFHRQSANLYNAVGLQIGVVDL